MSHSKKNTTRAFFTAHERNELKGTWGTNSTRLTRESFLPFGSCSLCLLQARDPVSCAHGHLFCRECALSNLLAQNKEIKRLKKEAERRKLEEIEEQQQKDAETQQKDLENFERLQQGSAKRKATDDLERSGKRRGSTGKEDTSFWIPSQTQAAKQEHGKVHKQHPVCPVSKKDTHDLTLKGLITVKFSQTGEKQTCPSCDKVLSNTTKGVLARPCGHVLCRSCSDKFQKADKSAHNDHDETIRCYVCQEDITPFSEAVKTRKEIERGLIELQSDGTGFAGGGDNMVKREGLAFQFG